MARLVGRLVGLLVGLLVMVLPTGCADAEAAPVAAAKRFADAVYMRDVDTVLTLVEEPTRSRVAKAAEVASDQVGGRRQVAEREVFQIVGWNRRFKVASAELVSGGETEARVRLTGPDGQIALLDLVVDPDHGNAWRVRIPTPDTVGADGG